MREPFQRFLRSSFTFNAGSIPSSQFGGLPAGEKHFRLQNLMQLSAQRLAAAASGEVVVASLIAMFACVCYLVFRAAVTPSSSTERSLEQGETSGTDSIPEKGQGTTFSQVEEEVEYTKAWKKEVRRKLQKRGMTLENSVVLDSNGVEVNLDGSDPDENRFPLHVRMKLRPTRRESKTQETGIEHQLAVALERRKRRSECGDAVFLSEKLEAEASAGRSGKSDAESSAGGQDTS